MSDFKNDRKSKNKWLAIFFSISSVVFIGVSGALLYDRAEIVGGGAEVDETVIERAQCIKAGKDRGFLIEEEGNEITFYAPNFRRNNYTSVLSGIIGTANMCANYKLKEENGACIGVGCQKSEKNKGIGIPFEFTLVKEVKEEEGE